MRMETSYLVGRTIKAVLTYPLREVHPAWKSDLTPAICTYMAFLELVGGELVGISPCEVSLEGDRYPVLGLSLGRCTKEEMRLPQSDGRVVDVTTLNEAESVLPLVVSAVFESDPLGEGTASQLRIESVASGAIVFRHVMPPITLGIIVENEVYASNNSLQARRP